MKIKEKLFTDNKEINTIFELLEILRFNAYRTHNRVAEEIINRTEDYIQRSRMGYCSCFPQQSAGQSTKGFGGRSKKR